jgi:hypothetical protein
VIQDFILYMRIFLKRYWKKKTTTKNRKKPTFFFYSKSNKPSHFVQSLDMRTSILSLQKVIYILKQLIIRHGNCLQKYCNWERAFKINVKKAVTIIDINRPTQYYINNTMGIIWIYKHFNLNKCFGFPNGTLKSTILRSSLLFYKPMINFLGRFDWT